MKLIVGLGNPEKKYDGTRHNVGFAVVDAFTREQGVSFQARERFKAHIAELDHEGEKVLVAKPTTYYNLVGESVRAIADFYHIAPENILVIHDELALPFGTVRTREKGSDAGNNGIKSIIQHIGPTIKRIRIGIANDLCEHMDAADFVLSKFKPAEKKLLENNVTQTALEHIEKFINDAFEPTKITH